MLKYQDEINTFISFTPGESFPHSLLLCGKKGCGRHLTCRLIADKLEAKLLIVDKSRAKENVQQLDEIMLPTLVVFNVDDITLNTQTILLKSLEAPLANVYIVLLTENLNYVLPTIVSRCVTLSFLPYSMEQLRSFIDQNAYTPDQIAATLQVVDTPGALLTGIDCIEDMHTTARNIFDNISRASLSNAMKLLDRIAFRDERNKFNPLIFIKVMTKVAEQSYLQSSGSLKSVHFERWRISADMQTRLRDSRLNKVFLYTNYFLQLWELEHANA